MPDESARPPQAGEAGFIAAYVRGDPPVVAEVSTWLSQAASPFRQRLGADWEDALQEIRVEVFRLLQQGRFRGESSLRTYLWQVTVHSCIDALRKRRPPAVELLPAALATRDPSPLDRVLEEEAHKHRLAALDAMAPECREIWDMIRGGLAYGDISRRLGVSEGTLRVRAHRCRQRAIEFVRDRAAAAKGAR